MVSDVVPSTSGIAVRDTFRALGSIVGDDVVARALARLSPEQRRYFEQGTALTWVPNGIVGAAVDEVAREAQRPAEDLLDEAVRRAVAVTFSTVWRVLLRVTTDEALVARCPMIYARSRNVGKLHAKLIEPCLAELILSEWPDVTDRHLRTIGVGIQAVLTLAGRRNVRFRAARTPDGARYTLAWGAASSSAPPAPTSKSRSP